MSEHLDQPLFLLGHGVEGPADGVHGDKEYLYVVEIPTTKGAEWTVKLSGHSAFTPLERSDRRGLRSGQLAMPRVA